MKYVVLLITGDEDAANTSNPGDEKLVIPVSDAFAEDTPVLVSFIEHRLPKVFEGMMKEARGWDPEAAFARLAAVSSQQGP